MANGSYGVEVDWPAGDRDVDAGQTTMARWWDPSLQRTHPVQGSGRIGQSKRLSHAAEPVRRRRRVRPALRRSQPLPRVLDLRRTRLEVHGRRAQAGVAEHLPE